jgi:hypothetical protein
MIIIDDQKKPKKMNLTPAHLLGGLMLVLAYAFELLLLPTTTTPASLWGRIDGQLRKSYYVSIALAIMGFVMVLWGARGRACTVTAVLFWSFAAVSALWLPAQALSLLATRIQLVLAACLGLAWAVSVGMLGSPVALTGAIFLAGNSIWMDALVWPCFQ